MRSVLLRAAVRTGLAAVLFGGVAGGLAACSLIFDTASTQCQVDADCAARGAAFASMTCSPAGLCVGGDAGAGGADAGADPVAEVSAGHFHNCARYVSGKVACWGNNDEAQMGDGVDPAVEPVADAPTFVKGVSMAKQLYSGEADTCVLNTDATVSCWGANDEGQLATGDVDPVLGSVQVGGLGPAAKAAAGDAFNCALLESGAVMCWGNNAVGQLGDGVGAAEQPRSLAPVKVSGIDDAVSLALGESHGCVIRKDGSVACWGANDFGQLGMGAVDGGQPSAWLVPVTVVGVANAKQLSLGEKHSCAVLVTHEVLCWGNNDKGQLGDDGASGAMSPTPVKAVGVAAPKEVSAGGSHTCAHDENGAVYCWGDNTFGQTGQDPAKVATSPKPAVVPGLSGARIITVGSEHSCAQLSSGEVMCWGHDNLGQLGDARAQPMRFTPGPVLGL